MSCRLGVGEDSVGLGLSGEAGLGVRGGQDRGLESSTAAQRRGQEHRAHPEEAGASFSGLPEMGLE